MNKCTYCWGDFEASELRPYGRGGMTCFECAMKPENKEITEAHYHNRLERAGVEGMGVVVIDDYGVKPYTKPGEEPQKEPIADPMRGRGPSREHEEGYY